MSAEYMTKKASGGFCSLLFNIVIDSLSRLSLHLISMAL